MNVDFKSLKWSDEISQRFYSFIIKSNYLNVYGARFSNTEIEASIRWRGRLTYEMLSL